MKKRGSLRWRTDGGSSSPESFSGVVVLEVVMIGAGISVEWLSAGYGLLMYTIFTLITSS